MKVYIGFSVDMDRAYSRYNSHGNMICKSDKDYNKYITLRNDFIELTEKLIDYFNVNGYGKSVTWYVNQADYKISLYHKEILEKCAKFGELGLHTHFNSTIYNANSYTMSYNRNDWEEKGIINANNELNEFLSYRNFIFKSGNHIRCDEMFDALSDNLFSIDTSLRINVKGVDDGNILYDDLDIKLGTEPFLKKCKNGNIILEIPEVSTTKKAFKHVIQCEQENKLCFIKLQIHHWQYDILIPPFNELIETLKNKKYDIHFVDLRTMQKIFFGKIFNNINEYLYNSINSLIPNDSYYTSLKQIIDNNFFELSIWLFNNFDKRIKIIELFSGIGQSSLYLSKLGFSNITICDFDDKRCTFSKLLENKYSVNYLTKDFFDIDITNFDIVFFGNAINGSLCERLDVQVNKYQDFLDKGKTLIIHRKYGSNKEFNYLINNLKNYTIIKSFIDYFVLEKEIIAIKKFSDIFKTYNTIGFEKNIVDIILLNNQEVIRATFYQDVSSSAGIYFPIAYLNNDLQIDNYKCTLSFDIKIGEINKESRIKIYTGIQWVTIEQELSLQFQTITFVDNFNFFKPSTYRIGFINIENNILFLKNIKLEL